MARSKTGLLFWGPAALFCLIVLLLPQISSLHPCPRYVSTSGGSMLKGSMFFSVGSLLFHTKAQHWMNTCGGWARYCAGHLTNFIHTTSIYYESIITLVVQIQKETERNTTGSLPEAVDSGGESFEKQTIATQHTNQRLAGAWRNQSPHVWELNGARVCMETWRISRSLPRRERRCPEIFRQKEVL